VAHRGDGGLESYRRAVVWLDGLWPIPGTNLRFGYDALLGLVPGIGDLVAGLLSCAGLVVAMRLRVPAWVFLQMVWNLTLDLLIGEVPVAGDVLDVVWQANRRNLTLLDEWRGNPASAHAEASAWLWVIVTLFLLLVLVIAGISVVVLIWSVREILSLAGVT